MNTTEAAELARIILTDSEDEHPDALYLLNVREARTLANAALAADRLERLADRLDAEAKREGPHGVMFVSRAFATEIRNALEGETA